MRNDSRDRTGRHEKDSVSNVHLWSVRRLAEDLTEQRLTQQDDWVYMLLWFVLVCRMVLLPGMTTIIGDSDPRSELLSAARLAVMGTGILLCARANAKGDDKDFLRRFICLGLPIGVRVFLCGFPPAYLLMGVIERQLGASLTDAFYAFIAIVFFWRLHAWIGAIAQGSLNSEGISSTTKSSNGTKV